MKCGTYKGLKNRQNSKIVRKKCTRGQDIYGTVRRLLYVQSAKQTTSKSFEFVGSQSVDLTLMYSQICFVLRSSSTDDCIHNNKISRVGKNFFESALNGKATRKCAMK